MLLLGWSGESLARPARPAAVAVEESEPPPSQAPPEDASAGAHASYAARMFKEQRFAEAGAALLRAYRRDPKALYLFNAGQAFRRGDRFIEARDAYEQFVRSAPRHPYVPEARGYISTLQAAIDQQAHAKESEQAERDLLQLQRKPIYKRAWFWLSIASVAAVGLAVGLGFAIYDARQHTDTGTLTLPY
jgi:tetratricopeptide (TPR) repeat protein